MASPITAAESRLAALEAQSETLAAQIGVEGSTVTSAQLDTHIASIQEARATVRSLRAMMDLQRGATTGTGTGTTTNPPVAVASVAGPGNVANVPGMPGSSYVSVTPGAESDPRRGFSSIGAFAIGQRHYQLITSGRLQGGWSAVDERMRIVVAETDRFLAAERLALSEAGFSAAAPSPVIHETQSDDGLMIPPDFRPMIWRPAYEANDLLTYFSPETTSSPYVVFGADETTPWSSAGIHPLWIGEGKQFAGNSLVTKPRQIQLHKYGAMVFVTSEMLSDAPLVTSRLNEKLPQAMSWLVSEALVRGDGLAKPLGYEAAAYKGLIPIDPESKQAAGTIYSENLFKMMSRVIEGPGSRIMWFCHRSTIPQLGQLKIGTEPAWLPRDRSLAGNPAANGSLLSYPIVFTQHAKGLGAQGDISLIDTAGMALFVHSSGTRMDASIHLYFDYDISSWRFIARIGGAPYLQNPVTPANGTDTQSSFIQLKART